MFNKKLLGISLIILILIITTGAVSADDNITDAPAIEEKIFDDIQNEIKNADSKDTIELEGTYSSQGKEIKIDKDLTIKGNATLDGKSSSRIFSTKKNVIFEDLTFINGDNKNGGAAVYSTSRTNCLTFINCKFINNKADTRDSDAINGGAISSQGNVTIINCTFKDNFAESGSAVRCTGESITVRDSLFINNKGRNIIDVWNNINIENTIFMNNTGFSIYSGYNSNVKSCNFTGNKGGIYCEYSGEVDNCNFINNTQGIEQLYYDYCKITVKNSRFENQNDTAVSISCESVIDNTIFTNNNVAIQSASWSDDPAISSVGAQDVNVKNCIFKLNRHSAIMNEYNHLKIDNCSFENNSGYYGSAIRNVGGTVTVMDSTLNNNTPASLVTLDKTDSAGGWHKGTIKISGKKFHNVNLDDSLENVNPIKIETSKLTTVYNSGDKLVIGFINTITGEGDEVNYIIRVYTGKKYQDYQEWSSSKGIAKFPASKLSVGTHNVEITTDYPCNSKKATTTVTVKKADTIVKAPKTTNKKYFKVSVKHKTTKKPVKSTWINLKIDKKTFKVKTNSKGIAKFNTKKLSAGKHKVTITSGNSNYKMSGKSTITIK